LLREASYFSWLKKSFASREIDLVWYPLSMELHPHIKIGVSMMQTQKRRKYTPFPLCLKPVYAFVLVNNGFDDRNPALYRIHL
jgi:hypothetical protein